MSHEELKLTWPRAIFGVAVVAAAIITKPAPTPAQEAQKACHKAFQEADAAVRKKHGVFMSSEGQKEIQDVIASHQACMQRTYARNKTTTKQERKP